MFSSALEVSFILPLHFLEVTSIIFRNAFHKKQANKQVTLPHCIQKYFRELPGWNHSGYVTNNRFYSRFFPHDKDTKRKRCSAPQWFIFVCTNSII